MSNKFKDISIRNHTYYLFDDINNIKNFDQNNIKINENLCKNILTQNLGYVRIKDSHYVKIIVVNRLYLIFSKY